jgi:hypothetical protein
MASSLRKPPNITMSQAATFQDLEHVQNPVFALRKIRSILKDDGIIAVSMPVYDTLAGWLVRVLDRDDTHIWKQGREH